MPHDNEELTERELCSRAIAALRIPRSLMAADDTLVFSDQTLAPNRSAARGGGDDQGA
jgi:hypothetical protein